MRRSSAMAVMALVGLLAGLTGCETAYYRIKANYAAKQGNDLYKAQGFEKAIEWYRYATYLNPEMAEVYRNTAWAYMALYKPGSKHPKDVRYAEEAIQNLKRYVGLVGVNQDADNYLLTIYLQAEKYDEAAEYFEDALKERGSNKAVASDLIQRIGMIYAKKGDFEKSLEWNKKRAEIEGDNPEAFYTIGVLCWDKVYRAPLTIDLERRGQLIDMGLEYLKRASDLRQDYFEAVLYINLLYRERAKLLAQTGAPPEEVQKWVDEANAQQKSALEMRKRVMAKKG